MIEMEKNLFGSLLFLFAFILFAVAARKYTYELESTILTKLFTSF